MTSSSSTISNPERPVPRRRRRHARRPRRIGGAWLIALAVVPLGLLAAVLVYVYVRGDGGSQAAAPPQELIQQARRALRRGDGIDAEMKLRAALEQGVPAPDVNAWMGEAMLAQDLPDRARAWLEGARFSPGTAALGWRTLAKVEMAQGRLPAAGRAFDRALAITPRDAALWVEIGRLRYAGGEHTLAIEAADRALSFDADNVRALEFRGQLVRDRYGLKAGIPWFERAIVVDPTDVPVLLEYAATLGELGRASDCVTITRRVLELSPGNPRAYYLQAVIAARASNYALARGLLARTKGDLDDVPGVQILRGVVELEGGNYAAAAEALEDLLRARPDDMHGLELLARALTLSGQYRYTTQRFADDIEADRASPYLLTTVARAWETLGNRQRAGELLDRAAMPDVRGLRILADGGEVGDRLQDGAMQAAQSAADSAMLSAPGSYDARSMAGDVQLAQGRAAQAQAFYAQAAEIRMPENLFARRVDAYARAGDWRGMRDLVEGTLRQSPTSRPVLQAAAQLAIHQGDMHRAGAILGWLRANGGHRDVRLLLDIAMVNQRSGHGKAALAAATDAYYLQRSNPQAAQMLGYVQAMVGTQPRQARALLDKAQAIMGATPIIAAARARLDAR